MTQLSDVEVILTILGMAAVTYSLRLGGLLMGSYLPQTGKWAVAMEKLPSTVLVALIAPSVVNGGPLHWGAALITMFTALKTGNLLISMSVGVVLVGVGRAIM